MASEKKQFTATSVEQLVLDANAYLTSKPGWEPIQLTYSGHKGVFILAFTARDKNVDKTWQFLKSPTFSDISGVKEVGVYWEHDIEWFVGVPIPA